MGAATGPGPSSREASIPRWLSAGPRAIAARLDALPTSVVALAFGALSGGLGLFELGRRDLINDEVVSHQIIGNDGLYWETFQLDRFNAAYFTLLRAWAQLAGTDAVALRLLSVLLGAAAAAAIYLLARRLVGTRTAAVATLLLALNSFFVRYEQTARTYTLVLLAVTVASLLLVRALGRGGWWRRVLYGIVGAGALYAHFFAAYVVAAQATTLLVRRRLDAGWLLTFAFIGLAALPLVWASVYSADQLSWIPATTALGVVRAFWPLSGGAATTLDAALLAILYGALGAIGAWHLLRRTVPATGMASGRATGEDRLAGQLLVAWIGAGAGLAVAVSLAKPSLAPRYAIVFLPPLVILVAAGIRALRPGRVGAAALLLVVVLSVVQLGRQFAGPYQDWSGTVAILRDVAGPGSKVVVVPDNRILALEAATGGDPTSATLIGVIAPLADLRPGVRDVWVVFESTETDEAHAAIARLTELGLQQRDVRRAGTIQVIEWVTPG